MGYEVIVEQVEARDVAAVEASATAETLADTIYRCLDQVWTVLREQDAKTDHNIVIYRDALRTIEVGVEVLGPFTPSGDVGAVTTPAGEVATTAHWGEYKALHRAYAALEAWCVEHDRTMTGAWEVYGDWDDDPAKLRTDVFFQLAPA